MYKAVSSSPAHHTDRVRDEVKCTLTKKKHTLHPKNEQRKQASEVEKNSSHIESAQKGDSEMWPQNPWLHKPHKKQ